MADHVIHVSEADAAGDFAGLLARVRAGAEIVIESGKLPVAVIHAQVPPRRSRLLKRDWQALYSLI